MTIHILALSASKNAKAEDTMLELSIILQAVNQICMAGHIAQTHSWTHNIKCESQEKIHIVPKIFTHMKSKHYFCCGLKSTLGKKKNSLLKKRIKNQQNSNYIMEFKSPFPQKNLRSLATLFLDQVLVNIGCSFVQNSFNSTLMIFVLLCKYVIFQ